MGVSGVEGTMRHCCEKTLTVLRDQRQIIITLLQVLLYDPLFKWSITPAKAHDIQSGISSRLIENNQCKYNFYFHFFFSIIMAKCWQCTNSKKFKQHMLKKVC